MTETGSMWKAARVFRQAALALFFVVCALPVLAQEQRVETSGAESPAVIGRDVSIVYGFKPEEVQKLTESAAAGAAGPLTDKIVDLSNKLGVTQGAVVTMLRIVGQKDVPLDKLPQILAEVAEQYKSATERLAALNPEDPVTGDLVKRANEAFNSDPPRLEEAEQLVSRAEEAEIAAARQAQELAHQAQTTADQRLLRAAADRGLRGNFAMVKLHYLQAAEHFDKAAELVPSGHPDNKGMLLEAEARAFYREGREHADNAALVKAIATYRLVLQEMTRERVPLQWAKTQNDLGVALDSLGGREGGTARLEEAVAAFRAALEELTRERAPLQWARTQNELGNALVSLGARESGTARLEEAVAAYRAALEERTRERVPLQWAKTQNDLGNALRTLGVRVSSTARLEDAVAAYHAALEELTRDRVPLDWAKTQNDLGIALRVLGARENNTARLEEAVAAHRAALQERPRERVPIYWATTQDDLGTALRVLGARESGTARLEEAVAAYRAGLEQWSRDRVPLYWAKMQNDLGTTLRILGERENDTARLEEAIAAHRAALEELTRERATRDWANTRFEMGIALTALGERANSRQQLQEALACFQEARSVFKATGLNQQLSHRADAMIVRVQHALARSRR